MSGIVHLAAGSDEVTIGLVGTEALAWRSAGRDLLWRADPTIWPRTRPVLYPIVGRVRHGAIRVDGRSYQIPVHGFAATSRFAIVAQSTDTILLRVEDDERTRACFPFGFRLEIGYSLAPGTLDVTFRAGNPGPGALPYALGLHPGFAWPFAGGLRDSYHVQFEAAERSEVPEITPEGLFSPAHRPVPTLDHNLPLSDAPLGNEALCLLNASSRSVSFVASDTSSITMRVEDFPHFAIWSRPPASFLSTEAWTGHGDPHDFDGELSEKPAMRHLAVGAEAQHAVRMCFIGRVA